MFILVCSSLTPLVRYVPRQMSYEYSFLFSQIIMMDGITSALGLLKNIISLGFRKIFLSLDESLHQRSQLAIIQVCNDKLSIIYVGYFFIVIINSITVMLW